VAEASIFIVIAGAIAIGIAYLFNIRNLEPLYIFLPVVLLLIPGFYAAVISGPFVPSTRKRYKAMVSLADLKPSDIVYDMGFGDGRLVFASSKTAKKAIGYELSIPLYLFGLIRKYMTLSPVQIRYGNIWNQDYRDANVIYCYLLPKAMHRFYAEVWPTLKPGTRVISNAFPIHETQPTKTEEHVYLYIKK